MEVGISGNGKAHLCGGSHGAGTAVDFQISHNSAQRVRAYNSDAGNGRWLGSLLRRTMGSFA